MVRWLMEVPPFSEAVSVAESAQAESGSSNVPRSKVSGIIRKEFYLIRAVHSSNKMSRPLHHNDFLESKLDMTFIIYE